MDVAEADTIDKKKKKRVRLHRLGWKVNGPFYLLMLAIAVVTVIGIAFFISNAQNPLTANSVNGMDAKHIQEMSYDERRYFASLDEQFIEAASAARIGSAIIYSCLWFALGACAVLFIMENIRLPKTRMAALMVAYTDLSARESLSWLEQELAAPIHDSFYLTITESWILGRRGKMLQPVALPLDVLEGFYTYARHHHAWYLKKPIVMYTLLLVDCFGDRVLLRVGSEDEMEKAAELLDSRCPLALQGDYSDFLMDYSALSIQEREKIVDEFIV